MAGKIELTILMPCLNEAETIGRCVEKAKSYLMRGKITGEVLVADNGSTDGSIKLAEAKGARVVRVRERGYGAALRGGIEAARGRYVIMGDADDSYDFSRLEGFVAELRRGVDLVMGNRFQGGIAADAMPFQHRYLGNPVLSFIGRLFFGTKVGDIYCGLRGFNRARIVALGLRADGMEFANEMVVAAALRKYRIAEVPTTLKKDGRSRPPHLRTWRDGWRTLRFLLMFSPRWLFVYPGIALIAFGLVFVVLLFPGPVHIAEGVNLDIHTFIASAVAILIGVQSIGFGVMARRLATAHGFLPRSERYGGMLEALTLERGLILGGIITAAGLVGLVWSLLSWAQVDFGPLRYPLLLRVLTLSLTGIAVGFQLGFTAFLSAMIDLPIRRGEPGAH